MSNKEILEEAAENYSQKYSQRVGRKYGFMDGAEYQAKKMYSEEDLRKAFNQGQENVDYNDTYGWSSRLTEQDWFSQFKKQNNEI